MSTEEFVKQKKSKGKKKATIVPLEQPGMQSQFAPLEETIIIEPLQMPAPIQTKPKKISPLIRNAIKSQPEELQFNKVEVAKVEVAKEKPLDEEDSNDEDVDVTTDEEEEEEEEDYEMCPGCYHCNWTGVNTDGKADCKRHYYGDVN